MPTSDPLGFGPPPQPGRQAWNAPPGMYFDPVSGLVLPEGVELASVARRVGAFFLSIGLAIVTLGIGYLIWGLIVWGGGRTPALQVLGMRCWRPETERVAGWWWMALREVVGRILLDITVLIAVASFILMLVTRRRLALHDVVAGTVVLRDPNGVLRG
ncbi:MAG: RDD family protein [Acidimicrobiaceae bacterium]|nr:RDD family protein [Acidimicrobiaceae bacterium]